MSGAGEYPAPASPPSPSGTYPTSSPTIAPTPAVPARAPFAIEPQRIAAAAGAGALTFAIGWAAALVATLLALIGFASWHPGWSLLFTAPGQFVALALGGSFHVGAGVLGVSASVSVSVVPVLLTAVLIAAAAVLAVRDERRGATTPAQRWLLSAVSGASLTIVAVVIAAALRARVSLTVAGDSGSMPSGSAVSLGLVLGALVIGTLVPVAARTLAVHTAAVRQGAPARPFLRALRGTVVATLGYPLHMGILLTLAGLVVATVKGGGTAVLSAPLWLPTAVTTGLSAVLLVPLELSGSLADLAALIPDWDVPSLWLPTAAPVGVTVAVILVDLVLLAVLGLLLATVRAPARGVSGGVSGADWALTIGSFALLGVLLSLLGSAFGVVHVDAGVLADYLGSADLDATTLVLAYGPAAWTFIVFALFGALVQLAALVVAPLARALPVELVVLLRRLAGDRTEREAVAAERVPLSANGRRAVAGVLIGAGALVLLIGVGTIARTVVNSVLFSPERQVAAYLDDLVAGSAAVIGGDQEAADASLWSSAANRISGYRIDDTEISGDTAQVTVTLVQGTGADAVTDTVVVGAERLGSTDLLFDRWRVEPLAMPTLSIAAAADIDAVAVNGVSVPLTDGAVDVVVLPGDYEVTLPSDSQWLEASAQTVTLDLDENLFGQVVVEPTATQALTDTVSASVQSFIAGCAASVEVEPEGCPFGAYSWYELTDVHWTVTAMPTFDLEVYDGMVYVVTESEGTVRLDYSYEDYSGDTETDSEDYTFGVDGSVSLDGGTPSYSYDDWY
ncbi:MAG: hypothetical protein QM635_11745 [Microbacteriaceae bacterium]